MLRDLKEHAGANSKTEHDAGRYGTVRYHCPVWVCARTPQQAARKAMDKSAPRAD